MAPQMGNTSISWEFIRNVSQSLWGRARKPSVPAEAPAEVPPRVDALWAELLRGSSRGWWLITESAKPAPSVTPSGVLFFLVQLRTRVWGEE